MYESLSILNVGIMQKHMEGPGKIGLNENQNVVQGLWSNSSQMLTFNF